MGMILLAVGGLIMFVGFIWMVINAFKTSLVWGICSLLIPLVAMVFAILNWSTNKTAFLIWLAGLVIYIVGMVMYMPTLQSTMPPM